MTTTTTLRTNCCENGKANLRYIPKEACKSQDIDPPVGAFYINANNSGYPDPAWERIFYCPFCAKPLAVPVLTKEEEEESTKFRGVKAARVKLDELDEDGWTEVSPHEHYRSGFAYDEVDEIAREALDEVERLQRGLRGGIACAKEDGGSDGEEGKVTGAYLECVLHNY